MKNIRRTLPVLLALVVLGALPALAQEHPTKHEHPKKDAPAQMSEHPAPGDDVVAALKEAGRFTTLVAAIEAAGLNGKLQGEGPFTIFAPTDEAFAKLPKDELAALLQPANQAKLAGILAAHVVPGKIMAKDIKTMKATNVNGQDLHIDVQGDRVRVDGAQVVGPDLQASNGVIHAIDRVIFPAAPKQKQADKPKDHPAH